MTITLAALPSDLPFWMIAAALGVAGILITVAVYGAVALIVKADDAGLHMCANGRLAVTRWLGGVIVRGMPAFMKLLVIVGTAAMIWVGGSIIVHGLHEMGVHAPYDLIHKVAVSVAQSVSDGMAGAVEWVVTATLDGMIGLALGFVLIPFTHHVLGPVARLFRRRESEADASGH